MNLKMLKHTAVYFIAFTIIIGLTSTFVAKQFIDQKDLIGLTGSDITRMQIVLNGSTLSEKDNIAEKDKSKPDGAHDPSEEEDAQDDAQKEYQKGDAGSEIKEYQTILSQLGYLQSKPDGAFGSMTHNAIINYQEENKLEATGKLDKKTIASLKKAGKEENTEKTSSGEKQESTSKEYTVQSGDSIYTIGEKYGVPVNELLRYNNLTESSLLQLGQKIKIPEKN